MNRITPVDSTDYRIKCAVCSHVMEPNKVTIPVSNLARDADVSIDAAIRGLELCAAELAFLIAVTPSGPKRNRLTEFNIHVMNALQGLKELTKVNV